MRIVPGTAKDTSLAARSWLVAALLLAMLPSSARALDTAPWREVLSAHARENGMDYAALSADATARRQLSRFVASISSMPERAHVADLINAYNALVVSSVLEHYPIDSVKSVTGFFEARHHRVAGEAMSLNQLESLIRERADDARIHFALNCGATSCPPLPPRPLRSESLDRTLDTLTRAALALPTVLHLDDDGLRISEIFFWYREDFLAEAPSLLAWIRAHAGEELADMNDGPREPGRIPYDWRLNQRPRR